MRWSIVTHAVLVAAVVAGRAAGAAKAPDGPDSPSCLTDECHADLKEPAHLHGPLKNGLCNQCHEPNPPGHKFKLANTQPALCTSCHPNVADKEHIHDPVRTDACTECHDPHAAATKALLTSSTTAKLCDDCHGLAKAQFAHGPVAVGECMVCHEPHQSDRPGLLKAPGAALCNGCHSDTAESIAGRKHPHKPAVQDCAACHAPHGADNQLLLRKPPTELCLGCHADIQKMVTEMPVVHGAVTELSRCANCHEPHAADQPFLLEDSPMTLCLACHDKQIIVDEKTTIMNIGEVIAQAQFPHGPIREDDCIACHQAHASVNFRLLTKVFPQEFYKGFDVKNYALCFSCHQQTLVLDQETTTLTGFRDGSRNLHYVHVNKEVKGRTCRACHEIHASNRPKHIRDGVPFGKSGWILPINFEKTDGGGRCSPGCHKPMGYERSKGGAPAR